MKLAQIRQRTAYSPTAIPNCKQQLRTWLNSLHTQYPVALTLTIKQSNIVQNANGTYIQKLDKDEVQRIAKHFTQKLNQQVFGSSAKRYGKGLKYLAVIEGGRTGKNLHLHMAIGDLPNFVKLNQFDTLVRNAKFKVIELDEQHKVDVVDSGWMQYITKELGKKDTDNVLWDLA